MLRKVLVVLCFIICLIFLSLFTLEYLDKQEGENFYKNVLPSNNLIDIDKLKNEYDEAIGYIEIPNTNISYPIMQGEDNNYYLKHLPNGDSNKIGSIFIDYRNNEFNDQNTIIYGHNFNNGTMFSDLLNYKSDDFYKNHSKYAIYVSDRKMEVEIFGVYVLDVTKEKIPINFETLDFFNDYIDKIMENNLIKSNFEINENDRLVSLCTCANGSWKNRLIVVGKVI